MPAKSAKRPSPWIVELRERADQPIALAIGQRGRVFADSHHQRHCTDRCRRPRLTGRDLDTGVGRARCDAPNEEHGARPIPGDAERVCGRAGASRGVSKADRTPAAQCGLVEPNRRVGAANASRVGHPDSARAPSPSHVTRHCQRAVVDFYLNSHRSSCRGYERSRLRIQLSSQLYEKRRECQKRTSSPHPNRCVSQRLCSVRLSIRWVLRRELLPQYMRQVL